MSRYQLKERERKVVIIGGIIGLLSLLYVYGVIPYRAAFKDKSEQLVFERDALARERAAIAAAKRNPALQHVADSLMQLTDDRLFTGTDDVMASADLGSYLGDVAGHHHVLLNSAITGAVTKPKSGVRVLTEDIRGESDLHGVLDFLQALERGPKLLRVSKLDISRPTRDADDIETVLFSATVSGYALVQEVPYAGGNTPAGGVRPGTKRDSVADKAAQPKDGGTP